jgi:hypothetical protein
VTQPPRPLSAYTPEERRHTAGAAVQLAVLALRYCAEDGHRPAFKEWASARVGELALTASPKDVAEAQEWLAWFAGLEAAHLRGAADDIMAAVERGDIPG